MAKRVKPQGDDWLRFVQVWDTSDHEDKLALCRACKITYDTGKHWRAEGDTTPLEPEIIQVAPNINETTFAEEIGQARIDLDFAMFDIETTGLTADFSVLLCACIKPFGKPIMTLRADDYPSWQSERDDDALIVTDVAKELSKHAIIVTHYGSRYDIPYLRGKMVKHGLSPLPSMYGLDTYSVAKANFKLSRRRLEALAEYFELGKKESVKGSLWMQAAFGNSSEAMNKIVAHCQTDVEILERLAALCFPYLKSIRRL